MLFQTLNWNSPYNYILLLLLSYWISQNKVKWKRRKTERESNLNRGINRTKFTTISQLHSICQLPLTRAIKKKKKKKSEGVVGKLGIVNSCEFYGEPSIAGHSHTLFSVISTLFCFLFVCLFLVICLVFKQSGCASLCFAMWSWIVFDPDYNQSDTKVLRFLMRDFLRVWCVVLREKNCIVVSCIFFSLQVCRYRQITEPRKYCIV